MRTANVFLVLSLLSLSLAVSLLVIVHLADDRRPPSNEPILWVCCTAGQGCAGVWKASECPAASDLFWCDAGESGVGPDGLPTVTCHDGD